MGSTPFFPGGYAVPSWGVRRSFPGGTASFPGGTLVLHVRYALSSPTVRRQEGGRQSALSWEVRRFLRPEGTPRTAHFHGGYAILGVSGLRWRPGIFMGGTPFPGSAGLPGTMPEPGSWEVRRSRGRRRAGAFMEGTPFRCSHATNGDAERAHVHGRYAICAGPAAARSQKRP
jgi:hypothetical protein